MHAKRNAMQNDMHAKQNAYETNEQRFLYRVYESIIRTQRINALKRASHVTQRRVTRSNVANVRNIAHAKHARMNDTQRVRIIEL